MSLSASGQAEGSSWRTIEVTVHRCNNISVKQTLGIIERKRKYFVKVSIGDQSRDTSVRLQENGSIEWGETFTFHDVQRSLVALGLYYHRTGRSPKLVDQLTERLPQAHDDDEPSPLRRRMSFISGPSIEFGVTAHGAVRQPAPHVAEKSDGIRSETEQPEPEVPLVEGIARMPEELEREEQQTADVHKAEEGIKEAEQVLKTRQTLGEHWEQVLRGITRLRDFTSPFAKMNGYAEAAHTIFFALTVPLIEQADLDEAVRNLLDSISSFCSVIGEAERSALGKSTELRDVSTRANKQILDIAYFIRDSSGQGFLKRAVKNLLTADSADVEQYRVKIENLKAEFNTRLLLFTGTGLVGVQTSVADVRTVVERTETMVVRVLKQVNKVDELANSFILENIAYVPGAGWSQDKICLEGTRTGMLSGLVRWADSADSRALLLFGGAGTGKSSIAHTIAAYFEGLGRLGSMFCFSESEKDSRKPASLFPHIARDLADLDENIKAQLCRAAQNKAARTTSSLITQFETLILSPANAYRDSLHGPVIIVIDALDESGTLEDRRGLLQVLASRLKELPPNFRVIITSRPDQDIRAALVEGPDLRVKTMDSIPPTSTADDISIYVKTQLADDPEASDHIRQGLALHARGLFQWAKVACAYIRGRGAGETALGRFRELTRPLTSADKKELEGNKLLDYLYMAVLSRIFPSPTPARLRYFKLVMARVLMAYEPLACRSLNQLLTVSNIAPKDCKADNVIVYLGSLLSGTDGQDTPIRPLHTSFRDFLTDSERSQGFFIDLNDSNTHADMALASMSIMRKELKFNICRLESSYLANKDVPDIGTRVDRYISRHLSYACRFWAAHLCAVLGAESDPKGCSSVDDISWNGLMKQVEGMTRERLLYWLEVLSVESALSVVLQKVRRLAGLMKTAKKVDKQLLSLMKQAEQFCSYFAKCIARSAPHIYISALPFAPSKSFVAKQYSNATGKAISLAVGRLRVYPSCLNMLEGHSSAVGSVGFSPDGSRIVSGSGDKTIRIWSAENGDMLLGPLHGHTSHVTSVAFSPDGSRIVSGSEDNTIRVWSAENGEMVLGPLQGHTESVTSVAFSPDGSCIVSGSFDKTIRIWNAENGDMVLGPLQGHTSSVTSVAFSPDGSRIVSGSYDKTIRIWSAENGDIVLGPLQGHFDSVTSVAFSPDGSRIVSGSYDKTIRMWSAENGDTILGPLQGHTDSLTSVAFSPDRSRIVSGSSDKTIRIWNAENGDMVLGPLQGHTDSVTSVAFSPDGSRIVSGSSDKTIRIWNVENGDMVLGPLQGHTKSVRSVAFSPDGSRIVSGSDDKTIRVWSAENGDMLLGPLQGHTDPVTSVAFSPDGSRIVSGSSDKTIRIWSADNGDMVLGPLQGHTKPVISVAFSPDGSRIVSGSYDKTIRIWSAENGDMLLGPLQGHISLVTSTAFSPDGSRIVSGSFDNTIRVWSAENGDMLLGPFQGHTDWVTSVAFSPDGSRIVSGSDDKTIRVWSAENGNMVLGPLQGHAESVTSVAFSPDGSLIVSGSVDMTIRIWSAENGNTVLGPLQGHAWLVTSVTFSPDGSRIMSGSSDKTIRIWSAENGDMVLGPLQGHTDLVTSVAFSPDGSRIVSGSSDKTIRIWSAENGDMLLGPLHGHTSWVTSVAFSPDGSLIVSGSVDMTIRIWNAENGDMALGPLHGHTSHVTSVAFSRDGSRIMSGSYDKTIRVWSAENGNMVLGPLQGHTESVTSVAFSPDGSRIVSGSGDKTVRIWSADNGDMVLGPLQGHTSWVASVAFSPDGSRIVSDSADNIMRIWDAENGDIMTVSASSKNSLTPNTSVAISPTGSHFVTGSPEGNIYVQTTPPVQTGPSPVLHSLMPSIPQELNFSGHTIPRYQWRMDDGWSLGPNGELLFYVPPVHRPGLCAPSTLFVTHGNGHYTLLNLSQFAHGPQWTEAFVPSTLTLPDCNLAS